MHTLPSNKTSPGSLIIVFVDMMSIDLNRWFDDSMEATYEYPKSKQMIVMDNSEEFEKFVTEHDLVVGDLNAPYCLKCSYHMRHLLKLARKHKNIPFVHLDTR